VITISKKLVPCRLGYLFPVQEEVVAALREDQVLLAGAS